LLSHFPTLFQRFITSTILNKRRVTRLKTNKESSVPWLGSDLIDFEQRDQKMVYSHFPENAKIPENHENPTEVTKSHKKLLWKITPLKLTP